MDIFSIYVKNDSDSLCTNPVITVKFDTAILGYVVNDTNEDKTQVEQSIVIPERGVLMLRPNRLGPSSFVDLTVWTRPYSILSRDDVSFASDGSFKLRTRSIGHSSSKEKFEQHNQG